MGYHMALPSADTAVTPHQPDFLPVRYETGTYYINDVDRIQGRVVDPFRIRDSCSRKRNPSSGRYAVCWAARGQIPREFETGTTPRLPSRMQFAGRGFVLHNVCLLLPFS
jgi:hypothetical protein